MIAEIPDPACATGSRVLEQITASRSGFIRMFGTPSPSIHPNAMVTIGRRLRRASAPRPGRLTAGRRLK
jgi:hypothetical protein